MANEQECFKRYVCKFLLMSGGRSPVEVKKDGSEVYELVLDDMERESVKGYRADKSLRSFRQTHPEPWEVRE